MYIAERIVFPSKLSTEQLNNVRLILAQANTYGLSKEQLAYVLATAYHESKLKPIKEYGGTGKSYAPYYGRGFVQLTHEYNYSHYGIAGNLDAALDPELAAYILVDGMMKGIFTKRKLSDYVNSNKKDYINARRVVNGTDKAELIAGYARTIEASLNDAWESEGIIDTGTYYIENYPKTSYFVVFFFVSVSAIFCFVRFNFCYRAKSLGHNLGYKSCSYSLASLTDSKLLFFFKSDWSH